MSGKPYLICSRGYELYQGGRKRLLQVAEGNGIATGKKWASAHARFVVFF